MSSTPAADLIDKHNAARKRIAELERAYDVLAEEKLDKLVSYKKRIAELEAELAEVKAVSFKNLTDYLNCKKENKPLRDALKEIKLKADYYSEIHAIAEQALEKDI